MKRINGAPIFAAIIVGAIYLNQLTMAQSMNTSWVAEMIQETEEAISVAHKEGADSGQKKIAAASAVKRFIPIGLHVDDLTVKLTQMKNEGFAVTEYDHEGSREWPHGKVRPYADEATKRNMGNRYPPGTYGITAVKTWRSRLVVEEFYSVNIQASRKDKQVVNVEASRSATSI